MEQITAESFLEPHYEFRRNVLRGMVEYRKLDDEKDHDWHILTQEALNSIFLASKRELGEDVDIKTDIRMYVESEEPERYDPIKDYLEHLPQWDGKDRVIEFWKRLPGINAQQIYFLSKWMRSVVVHWMGLDTEHANELVPLLIGNQGSEKSTFCIRFLPPQLRDYYLDHFNLANKFDKEMALSNCLLICLDELDQYKPGQQAELKQALSKVTVNGRAIYGRTIDKRRRYASFIGTTNKRRPLHDNTGSRRQLCLEIMKGEHIDNKTDIEYDQLYAQLMHEVIDEHLSYWFTHEETIEIQRMNAPYEQVLNLEQMIDCCFSIPKEEINAETYSMNEIREAIVNRFPNVEEKELTSIKIGKAMREMEVPKKRKTLGFVYLLTKKEAA